MSSSGFSIKVKRDDITPDLLKKLRVLKNPAPILRAMGTQLVTLTKKAFRDPSLRQSEWPAKSTGEPSNLISRRGAGLMASIRITSVDARGVTIGTDKRYGAIHQLGGVIRAKGKPLVFTIGGRTIFAQKVTIPARPYFPFLPNGSLAPVAVTPVREILAAASAKALGMK